MFLFAQPTRANDAVDPFRYGNVGITRLSFDLSGMKIPNQDYEYEGEHRWVETDATERSPH